MRSYRYERGIARPAGDPRDAEAWLRAVMEDAPPRWYRVLLLVGWRYLLRLRLGPTEPAPDRVLGWPLEPVSGSEAAMATGGPLLDARLVLRLDEDRVVHTTLVEPRSRLGGLLWTAARPLHELTIPWLLRRAAPPPARQ